jgi:hypothetical protein
MNLTHIMTLILTPIFGLGLSTIMSEMGISLTTETLFWG